MTEELRLKPSEGPCEIHDWPDEGIHRQLLALMRQRRQGGEGVNACTECLDRVVRVGRAERSKIKIEQLPHDEK